MKRFLIIAAALWLLCAWAVLPAVAHDVSEEPESLEQTAVTDVCDVYYDPADYEAAVRSDRQAYFWVICWGAAAGGAVALTLGAWAICKKCRI